MCVSHKHRLDWVSFGFDASGNDKEATHIDAVKVVPYYPDKTNRRSHNLDLIGSSFLMQIPVILIPFLAHKQHKSICKLYKSDYPANSWLDDPYSRNIIICST